jgi:hypothetical protein
MFLSLFLPQLLRYLICSFLFLYIKRKIDREKDSETRENDEVEKLVREKIQTKGKKKDEK